MKRIKYNMRRDLFFIITSRRDITSFISYELLHYDYFCDFQILSLILLQYYVNLRLYIPTKLVNC